MKFIVEFQDYAPTAEPVNTADVEEALFELLDRRGDDGIVIVAEIVEDED